MAYFIFHDGKLMNHHQIMDNRGLAYGDGFFSTMGVCRGQILFAKGHQDRLIQSSKCFELLVDTDALMVALADLAKQIHQGMIKIIITRGVQSVRGYGYESDESCVLIKAVSSDIYQGVCFYDDIPCQSSGMAVCLSEKLSLRTPRFAGLKLISSHEQVFIHQELQSLQKNHHNVVEGLVASMSDEWVSGAMSNVFYRLDDAWHTPPVSRCGVNGVMRQVIMTKFGLDERRLTNDDLFKIAGLAFCNAVRGVMPIHALMIGEVVQRLPHDFCDVVKSHLDNFRNI